MHVSLVVDKLKGYFSDEFINRIDEIISFAPMNVEMLEKIADRRLKELSERLMKVKVLLEYGADVARVLAELSYTPGFGVRPLLRKIVFDVENPIAEMIVKKELVDNQKVSLYIENGAIKIKKAEFSGK